MTKETVMTLFCMKRDGNIIGYCYGAQDMSYYGEYKQDYEQIIEAIVVPLDETIIMNRDKFKPNAEKNDVVLKDSFTTKFEKYKKEKKK